MSPFFGFLRLHSYKLFVAAAMAVLFLAALTPTAWAGPRTTRTIPCATDNKGKEIVFNGDNPYHCTIVITDNGNGTEDVVIHQPVVDRSSFDYTQITFQPGDMVTITADGCVQTAGMGSTWKRYVDPSGSNSGAPDGLYFGEVTIGSASWGIGNQGKGMLAPGTPISFLSSTATNHAAATIFIPTVETFPFRPITLTLGYKDDNWTDHGGNGYWGHDNGNNDQCANTNSKAPFGQFGGPAFVKLHIVHNSSNPFGSVVPKSWDLVPSGFDPNGLPVNPAWEWQVHNPQSTITWDMCTSCSSQNVSYDSATLTWTNWFDHLLFNVCNMGINVIPGLVASPPYGTGHHNWFDVTYHGNVTWVEHSGGVTGDDDYNMTINTPIVGGAPVGIPAGSTAGNLSSDHAASEAAIGVEFDSDETIDHFDGSAFWKSFHDAVDNDDNKAHAMVDHHDAIIIGLIGMDEMHGTYSEIHPVHALAIREGDQEFTGDVLDPADDRWFFFVRNWGDEGECSHEQHYLDATEISLQFPPPVLKGPNQPTFTTATLNEAQTQVLGSGTGTDHSFFSGKEGTFVTFNLASGDTQSFVFGEISLNWTSAGGSSSRRSRGEGRTPRPQRPAWIAGESERQRPEIGLRILWDGFTPEQRQTYSEIVSALYPPKAPRASIPLKFRVSKTPPRRSRVVPRVHVAPATEKLRRDSVRLQALCAATGGHLPKQLTWCAEAKVPPVTIMTTTGGTPAADGSITPVTVSLKVYDASGSGIQKTEYSLDGKNWKPYSGAFALPAGATSVYHRSTSKNGSVGEIRTEPIQSIARQVTK